MRLGPMRVFDAVAVAACVVVASVSGAHAEDTVTRAWAATCLSCHQPVTNAIPRLQGQTRAALTAKLLAFRDDARAGTVMPQIVNGYSKAQIEAITEWFAAQPSDAR